MTYALYAITFFIIATLFSMLGMGGSQLYIPILFWGGLDFKTEAIPLGLFLNIVNSSSAMVIYTLKKLIVWSVALPFAITMMAFAPLGVMLNVNLPIKPLLLFFALFTMTAGVLMLLGWKPKKGELSQKRKLVLGIVAGSTLGIIAGLIGRTGGSFVVPLLFMSGLDAKRAAATSSFVVTLAGLSSLISHLSIDANPHLVLWLLTAGAVFLGSQVGSRLMAGKMKPKGVKVIFGGVLVMISIIMIVKDIILK